MNTSELMEEAEEIDYSAVIARLVGEPLTDEQKEMCTRYDALYDAVHSKKAGGNYDG